MRQTSSGNFIYITLALLILFMAWAHRERKPALVHSRFISPVTYPMTKVPRHVFGDLAAFVDIFHMDLTAQGKTEKLLAGAVEPNFFQRIGVEPVLGRLFEGNEDARGHVVILSNELWQRRFGAATAIVGRMITLEGEPYRVIGVLPRDFSWNNRATDVWVPIAPKSNDDPGSYISQVRMIASGAVTKIESRV